MRKQHKAVSILLAAAMALTAAMPVMAEELPEAQDESTVQAEQAQQAEQEPAENPQETENPSDKEEAGEAQPEDTQQEEIVPQTDIVVENPMLPHLSVSDGDFGPGENDTVVWSFTLKNYFGETLNLTYELIPGEGQPEEAFSLVNPAETLENDGEHTLIVRCNTDAGLPDGFYSSTLVIADEGHDIQEEREVTWRITTPSEDQPDSGALVVTEVDIGLGKDNAAVWGFTLTNTTDEDLELNFDIIPDNEESEGVFENFNGTMLHANFTRGLLIHRVRDDLEPGTYGATLVLSEEAHGVYVEKHLSVTITQPEPLKVDWEFVGEESTDYTAFHATMKNTLDKDLHLSYEIIPYDAQSEGIFLLDNLVDTLEAGSEHLLKVKIPSDRPAGIYLAVLVISDEANSIYVEKPLSLRATEALSATAEPLDLPETLHYGDPFPDVTFHFIYNMHNGITVGDIVEDDYVIKSEFVSGYDPYKAGKQTVTFDFYEGEGGDDYLGLGQYSQYEVEVVASTSVTETPENAPSADVGEAVLVETETGEEVSPEEVNLVVEGIREEDQEKADNLLDSLNVPSENAMQVEIRLESSSGSEVQPRSSISLWLPYPSGTGISFTFRVYHIDPADGTATLLNILQEKDGIRFTVSSLSPFVITWKEPASIVTPKPDTTTSTGSSTISSTSSSAQEYVPVVRDGSTAGQRAGVIKEDMIAKALKAASNGKNAKVYITDYAVIGKAVVDKITAAVAFTASKYTVTVDPAKLTEKKDIKLGVRPSAPSAQSTFERFFNEPIATIYCAQRDTFGGQVYIDIKPDKISNIDVNKPMYVFSWNAKTNSYKKVGTAVKLKNGWVRCYTDRGYDLVISNSETFTAK